MNFNRTITASLLLSVLNVGAIAQPQITREQVKAELREAIRTGDIIEGEAGLTRYERSPSAHPARPAVVGKTREQVNAELREAIRTGDIVDGYEGLTRYERNPSAYPARTAVAGRTHEEVKAELAEAIRAGDMVVGESSLKLNEQFPGRYPKAPALARTKEDPAHVASGAPQASQLR